MNIQPKPETLVPQSVTTGPLPGSHKIYHRALGHEDILVPFREIALDPSANEPPVRVYDASGPYSEDNAHIDLAAGLPRLRAPWLARRAGIETYTGRAVKPEDNGSVSPEKLVPPCPAATSPRAGGAGQLVTQYEFARAGIITEEMIFVAARENLGRELMVEGALQTPRRRRKFRRLDPGFRHARIRPRRDRPRPRHHPGQYQSSRA